METVGSAATLSDPKHDISFPLKIVIFLLYLYHLLNSEYLCHRVHLVHLIDLVSQEHTLLVSSLCEVLDLNYSLLHECYVLLSFFILAMKLANRVSDEFFLLKDLFEVIKTAVGLDASFDETHFDIVNIFSRINLF